MDVQKIASSLDHTLLAPTAGWADIRALCDDAMKYGAASICIPPSFVREASSYLAGAVPVGTVIGFPYGYNSTGTKLFEAKQAMMDGAQEFELVIHLGSLREGRFDRVFSEISGVKAMIGEEKTLKVVVESQLLNLDEKVRMCLLVEQTGADCIVTSTGGLSENRLREDVQLYQQHRGRGFAIKASGEILNLEQAQRLLDLGADRLGSSDLVAMIREHGAAKGEFALTPS